VVWCPAGLVGFDEGRPSGSMMIRSGFSALSTPRTGTRLPPPLDAGRRIPECLVGGRGPADADSGRRERAGGLRPDVHDAGVASPAAVAGAPLWLAGCPPAHRSVWPSGAVAQRLKSWAMEQ
jgi:hypothetical protein